MKQIIVVTNNRDKLEERFQKKYFYVNFCDFSVEAFQKIRDRSDVVFVCMEHEDKNEVLRLSLYLKDVCIEYEKTLYLFGNVDDVEIVKTYVPHLYIKNSRYAFEGMDPILEELSGPDSGITKPGFLLIDEDMEYVELVRDHLCEEFNVFVSHYDPFECEYFSRFSFSGMMSMDGMVKISSLFRILITVNNKRYDPDFHFYLLASSNFERDFFYEKSERIGISLSKEMDIDRIAKYLISRAKPKKENNTTEEGQENA